MTTASISSSETTSASLSLYGWQANRQSQAMECLLDYLQQHTENASSSNHLIETSSSCEEE